MGNRKMGRDSGRFRPQVTPAEKDIKPYPLNNLNTPCLLLTGRRGLFYILYAVCQVFGNTTGETFPQCPPASCSTGNTPSSNIVVHAQARTLPLYVHRAATVIRVYGGRDETRTAAVTRACGSRRKVNIQQKWGRQPAGTIIKYRKEKADFKQKLGRQSAGKEAGKLKNDAPGR